jgi:nitrate/nitrite-specific signal transduction histidine kinase
MSCVTRERAAKLGGMCTIGGAPGKGTMVTAVVALERTAGVGAFFVVL